MVAAMLEAHLAAHSYDTLAAMADTGSGEKHAAGFASKCTAMVQQYLWYNSTCGTAVPYIRSK